jgi:hypothetical protein
METAETKLTPKNADFSCFNCDFNCSKRSEWKRHINTKKHAHRLKGNVLETVEMYFTPTYECCCGKKYVTNSGLWKHKKLCNNEKPDFKNKNLELSIKNTDASSNIIMELMKQNQEFKDLIIEQNKQLYEQNKLHIENNKQMVEKITDLASMAGSNNTNCNNKTFNLQVFLNEQCKDALNISEFVNQIKLQLSDLDMIGRIGYTEGMSKIIVRNLKELDIFKRPIHCSDLKREVLYVKDKDAWEKENSENLKIKHAIKVIESKNVKQLPHWKEENPESDDYDSKKHMEYHNIIIESMGGSTTEDDNKKHEKIIRNIAKEVVIDKNSG